jgi:hypothetical protein
LAIVGDIHPVCVNPILTILDESLFSKNNISDIGCIPGSVDVKLWISHAKKNTKNSPLSQENIIHVSTY